MKYILTLLLVFTSLFGVVPETPLKSVSINNVVYPMGIGDYYKINATSWFKGSYTVNDKKIKFSVKLYHPMYRDDETWFYGAGNIGDVRSLYWDVNLDDIKKTITIKNSKFAHNQVFKY